MAEESALAARLLHCVLRKLPENAWVMLVRNKATGISVEQFKALLVVAGVATEHSRGGKCLLLSTARQSGGAEGWARRSWRC